MTTRQETYIEEYLRLGREGLINIPKRVKRQYELLLPIIRGEHPRWVYDEKKANKPIEFTERFCKQSKDAWRGKPVKLLLWQKAMFSAIYGIVDRETGVKKHKRVFLLVGKKNGKTTCAAPLALYETSKKGNEVYCAANALPQAKIVWQEARNMLDQSNDLKAVLKKTQYTIKNIRKNGFSVFMPLSNIPNILDGKLPKVVILDEVHELYQDLYDILYNGQISCEDPLFLMLTTKGYVRGGLFDTEYKNSCDIIDGTVDDERKLSLLYELDDPKDWQNEKNWEQANPSLGHILTYEALRDSIKEGLAKNKINSVQTKHFNMGGISGDAWFRLDEINNEDTFDLKDYKRYWAVGGFDLSLTNDLTAFSTMIYDNKKKQFMVETMYWMSSSFYSECLNDSRMAETWRYWVENGYIRIAGVDSIDHRELVRYVCDMVDKKKLIYKWIYYDSYSARDVVSALVDEHFPEGEVLIRCQQGAKTLSVPFQRITAEFKSQRIVYNNNPVTKWCLTNVNVKEDPRNKCLLPCKAGLTNKRKIDGFASMLNCYVGVIDHWKEIVGE